jgi:hypothetical protein
MLKHARSFGESKEKIVDIEGDSFQSPLMDVTKVVEEMKEQKDTSLSKVKNGKL